MNFFRSTGIGRTGTFIAVDMILEYQKRQIPVDIKSVVKGLRRERMKMVQHFEQYTLLYKMHQLAKQQNSVEEAGR